MSDRLVARRMYKYNKKSTGKKCVALEFYDNQKFRAIDITEVLEEYESKE